MIRSFSISCCNFLMPLILITWEIMIEYKLMTCFPQSFPVFFFYFFHSVCAASIQYTFCQYFRRWLCLPFLLSFFVFLLINTLCSCLWYSLSILVFYAAKCLLLVYQHYLHKTHHHLVYFLHQPLPLLSIEIATIWQIIWHIRVLSITFQ